ncbi:MAG: hypothetical protein ACOZNI_27490 [Myxococcota bacterium]
MRGWVHEACDLVGEARSGVLGEALWRRFAAAPALLAEYLEAVEKIP